MTPVGLAVRRCPRWSKAYLRNLVSYLKQKQAVGVISLPVSGSMGKGEMKHKHAALYVFLPCNLSQQYFQSALRTLGKLEEEHRVIVTVRDTA